MKKLFISILIGVAITTCGFQNIKKEKIVIAMTLDERSKDDKDIQKTLIESTPKSCDNCDSTCVPNNKVFTLEELKKYNGENGNLAYIAVDGTVYDVTNSKKWKSGKHCNVSAGKDLSKEMETSPHGKEALKKLPMVGVLK